MIIYEYKSVAYANKDVGHKIFTKSCLGHVRKKVEKHFCRRYPLVLPSQQRTALYFYGSWSSDVISLHASGRSSNQGVTKGARGAQFHWCRIAMGTLNDCGVCRKVPTMSQVLSSILCICFQRPQVRTCGCQTCFLPGLTSLRPCLQYKLNTS